MNEELNVRRKVHFGVRRRTRNRIEEGEPPPPKPVGSIRRVARIMALAIRFDRLLRDGIVADQAELARLGHVTRARVTQIMNVVDLAPDIQEQILFLSRTERARDPTHERHLRPIAAEADVGPGTLSTGNPTIYAGCSVTTWRPLSTRSQANREGEVRLPSTGGGGSPAERNGETAEFSDFRRGYRV